MFDMISKRFVLNLAGVLLLLSTVAVAAQQPAKKPATQPSQPAPAAKKTPAPASPAAAGKDVKNQTRPAATTPAAAGAANKADAKAPWSVKVNKREPVSITLAAKNGKLQEIAADISKKLKVPVIVSPLMHKQMITQEFEALPLEGA